MKNKLKKTIATILLAGALTFLPNKAKAEFTEEQAIVLGTNITTSCLISGYGAKKNHKPFWKNCGKGILAGSIMYGGKELARNTDIEGSGLMGKGLHSLGVSMRDNTARGDKIFSRYEIDFGPLYLSFDRDYKYYIKPYILPMPSYYLIENISLGNELDLDYTLKTGTPVFSYKGYDYSDDYTKLIDIDRQCGEKNRGCTDYNIVKYNSSLKKSLKHFPEFEFNLNNLLAHEQTHALQYREMSFVNQYLDEINLKNKTINNLIYPFRIGEDFMDFGYRRHLEPSLFKYKNEPTEFEAYKGYSN